MRPDLSVHFIFTVTHQRHPHRDPVTGVRTAVCMYTGSTPKAHTAIRVSHPDRGYCLALMQTQRHRLEACADPCSGRVGGRESRERLRQIAPANCICGAKRIVSSVGVYGSCADHQDLP